MNLISVSQTEFKKRIPPTPIAPSVTNLPKKTKKNQKNGASNQTLMHQRHLSIYLSLYLVAFGARSVLSLFEMDGYIDPLGDPLGDVGGLG